MQNSAYREVQAFHSHHSDRTFYEGNPQIDPWMRNVLVSLQGTLNVLAKQIDENTENIELLKSHADQIAAYLNRQSE